MLKVVSDVDGGCGWCCCDGNAISDGDDDGDGEISDGDARGQQNRYAIFLFIFLLLSFSLYSLFFWVTVWVFERFGWKGGGILMDRLGLMCSGSTRVWILDGGV